MKPIKIPNPKFIIAYVDLDNNAALDYANDKKELNDLLKWHKDNTVSYQVYITKGE